MKRIHYALAAAMLCAATVSACKQEEPAALAEPTAVEPAAVEPAAVEPAAPASVDMAAPASVDPAAPAATEDEDAPHTGGDKVGG
jgi:hypothetical protein